MSSPGKSAVNSLEQRTSSVQQRGNAFSPAAFNRYDYDPLGQLTAAKRYTGGTVSVPLNPVDGQQFGFTYDTIGNRLTATAGASSGATSYTPNAVNQYTAIGAATPTYDADGNLYCEGDRPYEWNGGRTYVWDAENRLIFVTDNGHWMLYKYDAFGRRVAKYYDNPDYSHSTRNLSYDGWNLIQETGTDASLSAGGDLSMSDYIATYTWGQDLSGSLQGAGGVGGLLTRTVYQSALNAEPATTYYTYDGNGNVSELVDAAGTTAAHYEYGPFGEPVNLTSSSGTVEWQNPFRFSTKYADNETGFVYYGYRYYDSGKGRWVNRDPIEENGGLNIYGMVDNIPVNWVDFLGLVIDKTKLFSGGINLEVEKCEILIYFGHEQRNRQKVVITTPYKCSAAGAITCYPEEVNSNIKYTIPGLQYHNAQCTFNASNPNDPNSFTQDVIDKKSEVGKLAYDDSNYTIDVKLMIMQARENALKKRRTSQPIARQIPAIEKANAQAASRLQNSFGSVGMS